MGVSSVKNQRVSTNIFNQKLRQLSTKSYEDVSKKLDQMAQSSEYSSFSEIQRTDQISKMVNSKNQINSSTVGIEAIDMAYSTSEFSVLIVKDAIQLMEDTRNQISASDEQASNRMLVDNIDTIRDNFVSLLNYKHDSKYIFSGTKTNTPAIKSHPPKSYDSIDNITNFNNIEDLKTHINTKYFSGNSNLRNIAISQNVIKEYGTTADQDAFALCFVALDYIKETGLLGEDAPASAIRILDAACTEMIDIKAIVEQRARAIIQQKGIQEGISTHNKEYLDDIISTEKDIAEIMEEFSNLINSKSINEALSSIAISILNSSLK